MKVAVVWNSKTEDVINRFGQICPEKYAATSVNQVVESLRRGGHEIALIEGDKNLLANLEAFMPPDENAQPTGIVFNLAYGIQGECRYTHVPAMLEMAGVPYTGSSPMGHTLALDKVVTKILIRNAGVPTPNFCVLNNAGIESHNLRLPLIVKPRHESTSYSLELVKNRAELKKAVESIVEKYEQEALVEEYIDGREFCVGLLGNEEPEFLPVVESDFGSREIRLMTWDNKFHKSILEPEKICPAPISETLLERLREISYKTFRACHCKDYARVDIRVDREGNPFVLEINSMASLGVRGSYVLAATTAGYTLVALINRIVDVANRRYSTAIQDKKLKLFAQFTANTFDGLGSLC